MAWFIPAKKWIVVPVGKNIFKRSMLLAFISVLLLGSSTPGQTQSPASDVSYSRFAVFRIPFQTETSAQRLRQVQLYYSIDQGQSWQAANTAAPDLRYFDFRAARDGQYWFTVQTIDLEGRRYPVTMEGARPGLKVIVDTQAPIVRLRELPPRNGEVGVDWEVRDDNLDQASLRLEYRLLGAQDWVPIAADLPAAGQKFWAPATNGPIEVRLRARDRAENWNEDKLTLGTGAGSGRPAVSSATEGGGARPAESAMRVVNSTRIGLNYEIRDKGPSGISAVELWYTQDLAGRNWQKYREDTGADVHPPFIVDVNGEGLYGFTLIVRSGVGLAERPPQVGDQPQQWVEVDLTKPVVRIGSVDVGRGPDLGRLTINWTATDKNLGRQPIALSYAEQASGPWTPIANNLENSGRYTWQMPGGVPYKFLVRVEASDRAGNVGVAETTNPVIVDLAQPKGLILGVDPVTK
jgi:hypothetical protein